LYEYGNNDATATTTAITTAIRTAITMLMLAGDERNDLLLLLIVV
jgi:hypothetical protein